MIRRGRACFWTLVPAHRFVHPPLAGFPGIDGADTFRTVALSNNVCSKMNALALNATGFEAIHVFLCSPVLEVVLSGNDAFGNSISCFILFPRLTQLSLLVASRPHPRFHR
jgi:hypothetical protein